MTGDCQGRPAEAIKPGYRREIDALRGIAVGGVVLFHYAPALLPSGFLGVDVFFVISGLLITEKLVEASASGTLWVFYERRIRRIIPALAVVIGATLVLGSVALFAPEFRNLMIHSIASLFFFENVRLAYEVGYFDRGALSKPLMHLWSLSVEEQFYIAIPPVYLVAVRRWRRTLPVLAVLFVSSFGLFLAGFGGQSSAYYSTPARAWEFLAGALISQTPWARHGWALRPASMRIVETIAAALVVGSFVLPAAIVHSPAAPVLAVLGAVLFIVTFAGQATARGNGVVINPLTVAIGLISYSLYLWHWPLLSIAAIVEGDLPPRAVRAVAVAAALVLATASWRWIERPARTTWSLARLGAVCAGIVVGSIAVALAIQAARPASNDRHRQDIERLLSGAIWPFAENSLCRQRYGNAPDTFCMLSADRAPTVFLVGSSYANHLYPGIVANPHFAGEAVLSLGRCDPVARFAPDPGQCRLQDRAASAGAGPRAVIVSARWPDVSASGTIDLAQISGGRVIGQVPWQAYAQDLATRLSGFARDGSRVVVIGWKPELGYSASACFTRPFKPVARSCEVSRAAIERQARASRAMLTFATSLAARGGDIRYVDLVDTFCDRTTCRYLTPDGLPLLRDEGHLSELGSALVASRIAAALADRPKRRQSSLR